MPEMTLSETIERAMAKAVLDVQAQSEAIAAEGELSPAEKAEAIAAINEPDAMRARMLEARTAAKAAWLAAQAAERASPGE